MSDNAHLTRSMSAPPLPPLPVDLCGNNGEMLSRGVIDKLLREFEIRANRPSTQEEKDRLIVGLSEKLAAKAKKAAQKTARMPGQNTARKNIKTRGKKKNAQRVKSKKASTRKTVPAIRDLLSIQRKMKASSYTSHGMDLRNYLKLYDKNNSGSLDRLEFFRLFRSSARHKMSTKDLSDMFDLLDQDQRWAFWSDVGRTSLNLQI